MVAVYYLEALQAFLSGRMGREEFQSRVQDFLSETAMEAEEFDIINNLFTASDMWYGDAETDEQAEHAQMSRETFMKIARQAEHDLRELVVRQRQ